ETSPKEYGSVRRAGLIAIALRKGDELAWVAPASKDDRILLATKKGKGITFKATDARPMGRPTQGVTGIRLQKGDEVVGMGIARPRAEVLSVTANGYGKRTAVEEFPTQGRGGQGVILASLGAKTGEVAAVQIVAERTFRVAGSFPSTTQSQNTVVFDARGPLWSAAKHGFACSALQRATRLRTRKGAVVDHARRCQQALPERHVRPAGRGPPGRRGRFRLPRRVVRRREIDAHPAPHP